MRRFLFAVLNSCLYNQHLFLFSLPVSGLTILNERTAQCQSALGKLQRGRKAKPSMRLSTCLIHTKERALKHKSLLVSIFGLSCPSFHCHKTHPVQRIAFSVFLPRFPQNRFPFRLCLNSARWFCFATKNVQRLVM